MQRRTPIFIVTSSRPRVGKTLIARAMTEYFLAQGRPVAAFDVNPDDFKLMDHLPADTAAASIDAIRRDGAGDQPRRQTRCRRSSISGITRSSALP